MHPSSQYTVANLLRALFVICWVWRKDEQTWRKSVTTRHRRGFCVSLPAEFVFWPPEFQDAGWNFVESYRWLSPWGSSIEGKLVDRQRIQYHQCEVKRTAASVYVFDTSPVKRTYVSSRRFIFVSSLSLYRKLFLMPIIAPKTMC